MNRLNAQLWLGNCEDAADLNALKDAGISAVLNVTREPDDIWVDYVLKNVGVTMPQYCQLDHDDGVPFPADAISRGLMFLHEATKANRSVLIHCAAGISRTAAMAIAFLMTAGYSWDEAEVLVKTARPITLPHPELKRSVLQFFKRWPYDGSLTHGL